MAAAANACATHANATQTSAEAQVADSSLEEVRVVGQRDLLQQSLSVFAAVDSLAAGDQLSLNRTAGDWLSALPGVSLNGQGGLQQAYSVRGFSRWRIRTEVEGVPIITDRRAGNSAAFVPPEFLLGATVRRGPGSSLYGSGALGGVVGLSTIDPDAASVALTTQSNDSLAALTVAQPLGEDGDLALSLRRAEDSEDARGAPLNSGFDQIAGLLRGDWELGGRKLNVLWLPSIGSDIGKSGADFPEERVTDYPFDRNSLLRLDLLGGEDWLLRAYHHYQDWESDTTQRDGRRNETRYRSHTVGGLFYAPLALAGGAGRYGVEWLGRRGVSIEDRESGNGPLPPLQLDLVDGEEDTLGVFLDQQWSRESLTVGGGLRYDGMRVSDSGRERDDGRLNGSLALNWQPAAAVLVSLQAGTGFRFPTISELYFNGTTPRGDTLGNPELDPESSRSVELGMHLTGSRFALELSAYHSDLDDYIERFQVSDTLRSFRNLPGASIDGVEAQLSWQQSPALEHRLSYQWQRGEQDNGSPLADLNPPEWRYFLNWHRGPLGLSSDLRYRDSYSRVGPGELPLASALLWSAEASWRFGPRWEGALYVVNGFDEQYRASADDQAPFQPGRTLGVRLQWRRG